MFFIELSIIIFLIIFQSIFGIGLLILGTPTFIAMGYDFSDTLNLLLPISIIISFLQYYNKESSINKFVKEFNIYCLPFLIIFLIISLNFGSIYILSIYISLLLILSSLIMIFKNQLYYFEKKINKNYKIMLSFIGAIHGSSNMGGSFLSIICSMISNNNKKITRYYISYAYLIMTSIQYIIIILYNKFDLDFSKIFYILLVLIFYFPAQIIFKNINDNLFIRIINYLALIYGSLILVVAII